MVVFVCEIFLVLVLSVIRFSFAVAYIGRILKLVYCAHESTTTMTTAVAEVPFSRDCWNHVRGTRLFLLGMRLELKEKELGGEKKKEREEVSDTMLETDVWQN